MNGQQQYTYTMSNGEEKSFAEEQVIKTLPPKTSTQQQVKVFDTIFNVSLPDYLLGLDGQVTPGKTAHQTPLLPTLQCFCFLCCRWEKSSLINPLLLVIAPYLWRPNYPA